MMQAVAYKQYFPGQVIPEQTHDRNGNRSPSPYNFHMPAATDIRALYKIEKEAALKRLSYIFRLLAATVLSVGAMMLALVYANKVNVQVTLTLSTLPPCYEDDKLDITTAKIYLRSPMRAYVPYNVCSAGDVDVLVVVHSDSAHRETRQMIRTSWGSGRNYKNIEVLYVLEPFVTRLTKDVAAETIIHNDLLVPVPSKFFTKRVGRSIAALQWAAQFCPQAKFVVNILDSVEVNMALLLNFTEKMAQTQRTLFGLIKNTLAGKRIIQLKILGGHEVDAGNIAIMTKYKKFAFEDAYILTGDAVRPMCIQASKMVVSGMQGTYNENITVTGIWPTNAGVYLHALNGFKDS